MFNKIFNKIIGLTGAVIACIGTLFLMGTWLYGIISGGNYLIEGVFLGLQFNEIIGFNYYNDITGLIGFDNLIKKHIIFAPFYQGCAITGVIMMGIGVAIVKSTEPDF